MTEFRAYRIPEEGGESDGGVRRTALAELPEGDVLIRSEWSSINFKDALAVTGKGKILRRFPLTPGIDVAGTVESSTASGIEPGQSVLVTGCGMGEVHDGGFAEYVRVPAEWVVPVPECYTTRQAMALGTAGFTAALALLRMESCGQTPERGDIVVTGASGGVGSLAVNMLSSAGYRVVAVSGKPDAAEQLYHLGAADVVSSEELQLGTRPLEKARFGGVIDNVGGELLASLLPHIHEYGNVAAIGLAGGVKVETTVMPFILRGVSLLGISSANCPRDLRLTAWRRLGADLRPPRLDEIVTGEVALDGLREASEAMLARRARGRTLVRVRD